MCGIAGIISFNNYFTQNKIYSMLITLKNRGPEGTSWLESSDLKKNYWFSEDMSLELSKKIRFAFGCSRLAINDVSKSGLQPIPSNSKRFWTILNGEIFNFHEIKKKLLVKGYVFKTRTDTEVVSNAFEEWGDECFQFFNGQFSIAILDTKKKKLIIVRDRLGISPLYFFQDQYSFIFASDVNSIVNCLDKKLRLNKKRLFSQIALPYKLHQLKNETLFKDINQLEPARVLYLDILTGFYKQKSFWSVSNIKQKDASFLELKKKINDILIDSVKIRMRTDRKLAFIISGGIDSSATLGIAKKIFNIKPQTFSLDLPDARFNENSAIIENVKFLKLEHEFIKVTPNSFLEKLEDFHLNMDQPLATPNTILHMIMAEKIFKSNINVVLNGVGGDEVFFGYHDHFLYFLYNQQNKKSFNYELYHWVKDQKRDEKLLKSFIEYVSSKNKKVSPDFLSRSSNYDYRSILKDDENLDDYLIKNLCFSVSKKKKMDITKFTLPFSIRMDDFCYFLFAVEARQPFLDHRLVELGISSNDKYMIRKGYSKFILRQVVKDYIPTNRRLDKKKVGLNLPIDSWIKNELKCWITKNLEKKNNPIFNYASFNSIKSIISEHMSEYRNHSLKLWDLCILNQWLEKNQAYILNDK